MEQNRVPPVSSFELELWTDKAKVRQILLILLIIGILAWVAHFWGSLYWEKHSMPTQTLRGTQGRYGWAVTLYWWGLFIGVITPACLVIVYLLLNKKNASLALNKTGLFIDRQLIHKTLVPWKDISRIERENQGKVIILTVYFKNPQQIIEQQVPARQLFLKERLKDGEPLKCDNRLLTGDFNAFFSRAQSYLNNSIQI